MNEIELKARTKRFGLRVITLVDDLANAMAGWAIGRQLVRGAKPVVANYRAGRNGSGESLRIDVGSRRAGRGIEDC